MPAARSTPRGRHAAAPRGVAGPAAPAARTSTPPGREAGVAAPAGRTDAATVAPATVTPASTPTTPTEGAAPSPVKSPSTPSAESHPETSRTTPADPTRARGRRAAGPADRAERFTGVARATGAHTATVAEAAAAGRRAHRADGRASVRTPARGITVPATLATADAPVNRAERRRRRMPRRSATRVAKGVVAAGLALGVGGFALAPGSAERGIRTLADLPDAGTADAAAEAAAAAVQARLEAQIVQERGAAVVLASATAQDADTAKADAVAAAVPAEQLTALEDAVAELDTLIDATQFTQPAIAALRTDETPSPVLSGTSIVESARAAAEADAAAAEGATTTSDEIEPSTAPTSTATDAPTDTATDAAAEPTAGAAAVADTPADPAAARLTAAVDKVATLTAEVQVVTQQTTEAAAAAAAAAAEAARKEAQRTSLDSYSNGQIPASALCELDFAPGQQLRCDAAEALEQLNGAFVAAFGSNLVITDSYRSYSQQVACRAQKGSLCATPGTSNHGSGTAVDLGGNAYSFGTDQHDWMLAHAEEFGWTLPDWARASGSKPEPWHWEYVG